MSARSYALQVLEQVIYHDAYASLAMRRPDKDLSREDMGLVSELVYGTLRNLTWLEYQWNDLVKKKPSSRISALLDMTVYQLLFLDRIPAYAAVDEAVRLCGKHDKGFVNAILRNVQRRGVREAEVTDRLERCALMTSHPLWLLKLWKAHYGEDTAVAIAEFNQTRAFVYGRINTLKTDRAQLEADGAVFVNDLSFTYDGVLTDTDWFREGKAVVQDVSSALIPVLLDLRPGMKVLDVCAAPGTKTQEIAMLMENCGEITAMDIYPERAALIPPLMARTGVDIVKVKTGDACIRQKDFADNSFDRILIDAPCSGLGDLRHKPEIRFHVKPEDLNAIANVQKQILDTSCGYLKPDGILVYSTCTLNRKENEYQTALFIDRHPEFELISEKTYMPMENRSDGFYAAVMRKKGNS